MNDLDSLHKKAAAHYLQGNLRAALDGWKGLLEVAPADERALEGVRLCRHMLAARGEGDPPDESELAVEDDLAQLDAKLDLGAPDIDAQARPGMDLAWSLEDADAPAPSEAAAPKAAAAAGWHWNLDESSADAAEAEPEPEEAVGPPAHEPPAIREAAKPVAPALSPAEASRLELRRRANELLANALVAMEAGNHDEALRTLDRVMILDDSNEAARDLRERIAVETSAGAARRGSSAAGADAGRASGIDPAEDDERPIDLAGDLDLSIPLPAAPLPVTELPSDDPALEDAGGAAAAETDEPEEPAGSTAEREPRPRSLKIALPGGKWLALAALVAACGVAGFHFFGGSGGAAESAGAQQPAEASARPVPPAERAANPSGAAATVTTPPPADGPAADPLARALARAASALDAGDHAAAILAYNEALKIRPDHPEAVAGLKDAGERYKKEKERLAQWETARTAFADGSYRDALRLLYRLDPGDAPEIATRYKVNGWYNLGLQALRSGDCAEARSNFNDAREVQGSDEGLVETMRLARACPGDADYRRRVNSLEFRGLDDGPS